MGLKRTTPLAVPAFGLLVGGRLHGWRYHFLHLRAWSNGALRIVARCTPPNWPFPHDIQLELSDHFRGLRSIVGEKARRLSMRPFLIQAFYTAHLPLPDWVADEAQHRHQFTLAMRRHAA